jgi:nucleoside-diphosphate-sugar epimerase
MKVRSAILTESRENDIAILKSYPVSNGKMISSVCSSLMIVTVIGSRRGVGLEVVKRLVEKQEVTEIRALVRNVSEIGDDVFPKSDRLKIVEGDVSKPDTVRAALHGCTHAIYAAAGTGGPSSIAVDDIGVGDAFAACEAEGVRRMVLNSAQLVDPDVNGWNPVRMLLNGMIAKGKSDSKFRGENRVREIAAAGKTEYTIVRAGRLGDVETQDAMVVGQTNTGFNNYLAIARKDVAAVLVECLTSAKVKNTTFELGAAKGAQPCAVSTLLDGLPHTGDSWLAQTKK